MTAPIQTNHRLLRKVLLATAVICFISVASGTRVSAREKQPSPTPAELAAAIARTMNATKPDRDASSPIKQEIESHENVVEIRVFIRDAKQFAAAMTRQEDQRIGMTRYFCKRERIDVIHKGVVFYQTVNGPNAGDIFGYTIDEQACASLARPVQADAAALETTTEETAKRLATALPAEQTILGVPFQNEKPSIRNGVIQVVHVIAVPSFGDFFKLKSQEVRGITQGSLCTTFANEIRHGARIHETYQLGDGTLLLDFVVDDSVC